MPREHGFDFTQLNSESPNLDLVILAAEELHDSARHEARAVATTIKAKSTRRVQRVRNELFRREVGATEIAVRHAASANIKVPGHADRHWLHISIEDVHLHVCDRTPERN